MQNNKPRETLLQSYSVEEISQIFSRIDEKIISLHQCSSDDFLGLNEQFKRFAKDARSISENAQVIFDLMSDEEASEKFAGELDDYFQRLSGFNKSFSKLINSLKDYYNEMYQILDFMYIPTHHFNQNLMSLKLLRTNLKLELFLNEEERASEKGFDNIFNRLKEHYSKFHRLLANIKNKIEQSKSKLNFIEEYYLSQTDEILRQIKESKSLLSEKNKEAIGKLPDLSAKTKSNSQNISNIITNLQYHDIIRQKIEHVQQVHKEVITDLKNMNQEKAELDDESKLSCFIKIRDIARLQAAQLIHANKEYQKAIENITQKILDLGHNMTTITNMCNYFISPGEQTNKNHFGEIENRLQNATQLKNQLNEAHSEIKDQYSIIDIDLFNMISTYETVSKEMDAFLPLIRKIKLSGLPEQHYSEIQLSEEEIKQLIDQFDVNHHQLKKLVSNIGKSSEKIRDAIDKGHTETSLGEDINNIDDRNLSLVNRLHENKNKMQGIIKQNSHLTHILEEDIRSSIKDVKYYDFFDKTIEEITEELNDISEKLHTEEFENNINIDHLRKKYTMQSEHFIHETISEEEEKGDVDLFGDDGDKAYNQNEEEDNDNLELF